MARLDGKVCLITGGGEGIGRAAAREFARHGAAVVVFDVNPEAGERTAREVMDVAGDGLFIHGDASVSADVEAAIASVRRRYGKLHVIYNNASVFLPGQDGRITEVRPDAWERILAVNLGSVYLFCHYGIPFLIESGGGSVINTASSAGLIGVPGCDAYTASKGATISLTRSLAVEYGPKGVRVNCIAPAAVRTPMLSQSSLGDSRFDERRFLALRAPLRRYGTAEEIAAVAVFLASDESSYLNGAVITVDGGVTINGDLSRLPEDGVQG